MQSLSKKIFLLILVSLIITSSHSKDKSIEDQLFRADSLFEKKAYKESIKIYEVTLNENFVFSEKNLLRMCSVYLASGDTAKSIQTLEILFKNFPSKKYLEQIQSITIKENNSTFVGNRLEDQVSTLYKHYSVYFIYLLTAISLLLVMKSFFNKGKKTLPHYLITGSLLCISILMVVNIPNKRIDALNNKKTCYLREQPSHASNITYTTKGYEKFEILDFEDIWIKVKTKNNQYGYLQRDRLLFIF